MASLIKRKAKVPERAAPASKGGMYFTSEKKDVSFISSGCTLLDCVLGGGWPLGRIANIVGDKSTGKTLLAIEACANFAHQYPGMGEDILYIEAESAFDTSYAEALGLPTKRIRFEDQIDTVEALFDAIGQFIGMELVKDKKDREREEEERKARGDPKPKKKDVELRTRPGLIIVDSLDALSDEAEAQRSMRDGTMGASKGKAMSQLFRRLVRPLGRTNTCVLVISQVRDAIGITFGDGLSRSGGRALDFYASQALWLSLLKTQTTTIRLIKRAVALTIRARCKKNKISLPLRECEFTLSFGYGVEDSEAGYDFLKKIGKEKLAPLTPDRISKLRGREHREAREALNKIVVEQWYIFEKNFLPERSKYSD